MVFSSLVFLALFLPVVLLLYYTVFRFNRTAQNVFLLLASIGFYGYGEPRFVFVLLTSCFANWGFGLIIDKFRDNKLYSKYTIIIMLIFNLSIIFVCKYLMFTLKNINFITGLNMSVPNITLPIGISFFTFQAISYVIDVYRGHGEAQKNPLNVALYIAFFPQLVAGPIVRYETIAEQIKYRKETIELFSEGVHRFLVGFLKKILIANNVAILADQAYKLLDYGDLSMSMAWLGAIAYTLQIYYDFSGYSDMAIGLGKMFGFKFEENFKYPYISKSTTEFWRRWHISLGTWFRDYVYIPLGGSRVSTKRLYINTFVVWLLTGLWHGANWTFITWGLLYFVSISLEKYFGIDKMKKFKWTRHFYTMILVMIGWVIFRATSIDSALSYIKIMLFGFSNFIDANFTVYVREYAYFLFFGILLARPFAKKITKTKPAKYKAIQVAASIGMFVLFILAVAYLVKGSYNPFIYFNF